MTERSELRVASELQFELPKEEDAPPQLSGFAIHPGLFNKIVEIPVDELENLEKSLKKAQLRYDHGHSVFHVIGKVNSAQKSFDTKAGKEGIYYQAEMDTEDEEGAKVFRKIEKGYVNATSVGFHHDSICSKCGKEFGPGKCGHWFDEAHVVAKNCDVFELSVVSKGADGDATVGVAGLNDKFVSKFKKQFGGKVMEPKDNQKEPVEIGGLFDKVSELQSVTLKKDQKIAKLEGELSDLKELKAQFEEFKETQETAIKAKDSEIAALKKENKDTTEKLEGVDAQQRIEVATDLVERQVELKLIKDEDKEDEIKSLIESGDLDVVERMVARAEEQALAAEQDNEPGDGKVPKVDGMKKGVEDTEIDYDNLTEEQEQALIHTIFGYDRVFDGKKDEGIVPGHTFMGKKV